jgi:hypothetical protein
MYWNAWVKKAAKTSARGMLLGASVHDPSCHFSFSGKEVVLAGECTCM